MKSSTTSDTFVSYEACSVGYCYSTVIKYVVIEEPSVLSY